MNIIDGLIYYFPYYVVLVLVPAVIRAIIEDALKIRYYEDSILDPRFSASIDTTSLYRSMVTSGLYFPLFEEVFFRLIPLYFLGPYGLIMGDAVWVLMHPTWQLEKVEEEGWRKLVFFLTTAFYYSLGATFYSIAWLNGDGIIAILYHMFHNSFIILASTLQENMPSIKIPLPKKEGEFVKVRTGAKKEAEEGEEFTETGTTTFVRFKGSLEEEDEYHFVRRKKFKY